MPTLRRLLALLIAAAIVAVAVPSPGAQVPLRGDFPPGAGDEPLPVAGGVPFPRGALESAENVRLVAADGKEVPCQVTPTAYWPDRSLKWVLVDAVLSPQAAQALALEYGPDVRRAAVPDPVSALVEKGAARVSGGGVAAAISGTGGVLDECTLAGRTLVEKGKPARLVVRTLRIADGTSGEALPAHRYVCRDTRASLDLGRTQIEDLAVESAGPIRATIRVRSHVRLEHFGATLPEEVTTREPAGRMPFTLRLSFYRGCPVVCGQNQIVFSGEPDCDYVARWGIEIPGQAAARGRLVLEPGVELDASADGAVAVATEPTRLCWAPIKAGLAIIRHGWENRPAAVTHETGSAWVDFWPEAAGLWDLRRYAREWAAGESGDTRDAGAILRYAKVAARGLAKSHDFALWAGDVPAGAAPPLARALAGRALLVAPPAWYAATGALGPLAPEQTSGDLAAIDAATRRRIDYYLYCQDLYRWHGKLEYGFWQTRFGEVHRTDRWDRDYGRWGWSLNDGAGRIGHLLMLQYVRTLERRYLEAGEAFNRAVYDTAMVHTEQHLENAGAWWTAKGCTHRHNVQPFGCPYIGMRGSQPGGQRMMHLLTGDAVIADGLDLVADACFRYAEGARGRLCNSGGSDGQGAAAVALLWKYETTGDAKYLAACRKVLDSSALIPPADAKDLGYGPDFGLFNAAGEYAELSGDAAFRKRVVEVARMGAKDKEPGRFLYAIAMGVRLTGDKAMRDSLAQVLAKTAAAGDPTLADLPPAAWPGHAGWRSARADWNLARDVPSALAVLASPAAALAWPQLRPNTAPLPARPPADWFRPGGAQGPDEKIAPAAELLAARPGAGVWVHRVGPATWTANEQLCDVVKVGDASPLAGPIAAYVELATPKGGDLRLASKFEVYEGRVEKIGSYRDGTTVAAATAGPAAITARLRVATADGAASVRIEMACRLPPDAGRVASWGLRVPLKLSGNGCAVQTTAPGRFRLERCRLDQNDERIPNWLTSEYNWGEGAPLWPKWRLSGISIGPGPFYRIWRANRADTSPLFCDQGEGAAAWFDVTDRGSNPRWGLTVRLLRPPVAAGASTSRQAVRMDLEKGLLEIQFHDAAAPPAAPADGLSGAADLLFHDGWRPPLAKPELTAGQYEKFLDDLDYGGNYGLMALRFCLSTTHQVEGRAWAEKVRDLGIEPREILYGMLWNDGLAKHCEKTGVEWTAADLEGSVRRVIEHYRK